MFAYRKPHVTEATHITLNHQLFLRVPQVLVMKRRGCCWKAFMPKVCHVTIIYSEDLYLISATWMWHHACTWDQVCTEECWTGFCLQEVQLVLHDISISSSFLSIFYLSGFEVKLSFVEDSLARYTHFINTQVECFSADFEHWTFDGNK